MIRSRFVRLVAPGLFVAAIGAPACGGSGGWHAPSVVKIDSKDQVASLMPTWISWLSDAAEGQPQALLLRDGDYVFGSDAPFRYAASDGASIKLETEHWTARLGQVTVSVSLDEAAGREWLTKATEKQLTDLRMVGVPKEIDADLLTSLRRLASANPSVDLTFASDAGVLSVLPIFKPRCVFLPDDTKAATIATLANQPQLEVLLLKTDEPGAVDVLAKLPKLRALVLGEWDPAKTGPLPAGLTHLTSLLLAGGENLKDLSGLRNLPAGLEELSVLTAKNLADITALSRFTGLHTLLLNGDEGIGDLSGLASNQALRWVGLPSKTTQEQFAAFIGAHTNLAILDMMGNASITSLAPLASLKSPEGLILAGPYENLGVVQGLKTLRFVGLTKKVWDESPDQVAALRKALPDAVVVRVSPLCLGSGWILLLIPAMLAAALVHRRVRTRVTA